MPQLVAKLEEVFKDVAARDTASLATARADVERHRNEAEHLRSEMKRKDRDYEVNVKKLDDRAAELMVQLNDESAKAARFEARSEALESQLEMSRVQATTWHEMFVDLQNRGERKEKELVSNLAMSAVAKKQKAMLQAAMSSPAV